MYYHTFIIQKNTNKKYKSTGISQKYQGNSEEKDSL